MSENDYLIINNEEHSPRIGVQVCLRIMQRCRRLQRKIMRRHRARLTSRTRRPLMRMNQRRISSPALRFLPLTGLRDLISVIDLICLLFERGKNGEEGSDEIRNIFSDPPKPMQISQRLSRPRQRYSIRITGVLARCVSINKSNTSTDVTKLMEFSRSLEFHNPRKRGELIRTST